MSDDLVLFEVADGVATVTLNRPAKLNATTQPMMRRLDDIFTEIPTRQDISVVILRGAGRAFCAGHDVGERIAKPPFATGDPLINEQRWVYSSLHNYRTWLWDIPQPVIAQVHGYALTVGLELAMQCDLVYAAEDTKMCWRPVSGSGRYMHMWPWLIGVRRAKELLFTGRYIDGTEAAEVGMINAALPLEDLDAHVRSVAEQIARVPLAFLALEKQATNKAFDLMGAREGQEYAATVHAMCHRTEDGIKITDETYTDNWKEKIAERDQRYAQA
jgi:enoyl-CoA hydratase